MTRSIEEIQAVVVSSAWADAAPNDRFDPLWIDGGY
jgi:hypothetical protein